MTEQELEVIKLKLRVEAHSIMIVNLWRTLMSHDAKLAEKLQDSLDMIADANTDVVFSHMLPGFSNMLSDEFNEVILELNRRINLGREKPAHSNAASAE
ncbi:MAG: hypothetical protein QE278_00970 [Limnobacter sp.]|nr:hypothetical protein [Limnobacter sp.]